MLTYNLKVFPTRRRLNSASHQAEGVQLELENGTNITFLPGMGPLPPKGSPAGESGIFMINALPDKEGYGILTLHDENPLELSATLHVLDANNSTS